VLHLYDTAGIRESSDKIESIGIEKTKGAIQEADVVIVVLDASQELDEEDQKILDYVDDLQPIIVYNKVDLAKKDKELSVSALHHQITPLVEEIKKRIGIDDKAFSTPALNNARQIGLLKRAR
ncbi:MAG: GTP-binding protein, partial [Erysipelotrichia bacterium]|nr:GTP-binding protein [Erysipelotrichia bacterium]